MIRWLRIHKRLNAYSVIPGTTMSLCRTANNSTQVNQTILAEQLVRFPSIGAALEVATEVRPPLPAAVLRYFPKTCAARAAVSQT